MPEEIENSNTSPTLPYALKAALLIAFIYSITAYFALEKLQTNKILYAIINFTSITSCIFIALMNSKKNTPNITYKQLWFTGWMSTLILGVIVAIFFKLLFLVDNSLIEPPAFIAVLLLTYNVFGLFISALLAFTISKL